MFVNPVQPAKKSSIYKYLMIIQPKFFNRLLCCYTETQLRAIISWPQSSENKRSRFIITNYYSCIPSFWLIQNLFTCNKPVAQAYLASRSTQTAILLRSKKCAEIPRHEYFSTTTFTGEVNNALGKTQLTSKWNSHRDYGVQILSDCLPQRKYSY